MKSRTPWQLFLATLLLDDCLPSHEYFHDTAQISVIWALARQFDAGLDAGYADIVFHCCSIGSPSPIGASLLLINIEARKAFTKKEKALGRLQRWVANVEADSVTWSLNILVENKVVYLFDAGLQPDGRHHSQDLRMEVPWDQVEDIVEVIAIDFRWVFRRTKGQMVKLQSDFYSRNAWRTAGWWPKLMVLQVILEYTSSNVPSALHACCQTANRISVSCSRNLVKFRREVIGLSDWRVQW